MLAEPALRAVPPDAGLLPLERFGRALDLERPRVLFWLPHGIGDAILAVPAVAGLKRAYPEARIELAFFRAASSAVLAGHPAVDGSHLLEPSGRAFVPALLGLRRRFDLALLPGGLTVWKHRLALRVVAPGACAGVWPRHLARPWFSHGVVARRGVHTAALFVEALRQALPRVSADAALLPLGDDDHRRAAELWTACDFAGRPVLVAATGCEPSTPYKRWPIERFVSVVRRFLDAHPSWRAWAPIGPGEARHAAVWEACGDSRLRITCDVALKTVAAALMRARLLLANDSALAHLAGAVGLPSVVVFGPTDSELTHPLGTDWSVVSASGCDRQPCFPHFGEPFDPADCPHEHACLRAIEAEHVLAALEGRLQAAGSEQMSVDPTWPVGGGRRPTAFAGAMPRGGDLPCVG